MRPAAADSSPPQPPPLVLRASTRRDDRMTAQLHVASLDGMFVRFGVGFLRAYHASFRRSPHAISIVVVGPDGVVGFLVGTLDNEAHYHWLVRHALASLGLRGVAALVRRPRVALDAIRTRRKRYLRALTRRLGSRRTSTVRGIRPGHEPKPAGRAQLTADQEPIDRRVAVLTHVAVAAEARGTGAGRRLVAAFERALTDAGVVEARLITDPAGGASAFYRRLGWSSVGIRRGADGAEVEEFVRTW